MTNAPHYLLIGNGRVARHFQYYFKLLNLTYSTWHRGESIDILASLVKNSSHILLLIRDQAIESFASNYLLNTKAYIIHFSGSLVSHKIIGAHPLLCFNDTLYTLEKYLSLPFVLDHDAPDFNIILPGLPNQHVRLDKNSKAKYHAFCVMSGNFSCLLWQKLFATLKNEFAIPESIAYPYLMQQTQNLLNDSTAALTGPLTRGDKHTIDKHLSALETDPFQPIYASFVACYQQLTEKIK